MNFVLACAAMLSPAGDPAQQAADILGRINAHRKLAGLELLADDKELSAGCALHARYLVQNWPKKEVQGEGSRLEEKSLPGYSETGEKSAARSMIHIWSKGEGALWRIDSWVAMIFRRPLLLSPRLGRVGIGFEQGGNGVSALVMDLAATDFRIQQKTYPTVYPGHGQTDVPFAYGLGIGELPDPRPDPGAKGGYPITFHFYAPFWMPGEPTATLSAFGKEVSSWLFTPERPARKEIPQEGLVVLFPKEPLAPATQYTVSFKCRQIGIEKTPEWVRTWTFTTAAAAPPKTAAPPAAKRLPVPDAGAIREAEKRVRDVFKTGYASKTPAEKRAFARKLLDQGNETRDDGTTRYVLLRDARDTAVQAADPDTALAAIQAIAKEYDVNGIALKSEALSTIARGIKTPDEQKRMALLQLKHAEDSAAAEDFATAQKAALAASSHARQGKDTALAARADAFSREIPALREAQAKAREAEQRLAIDPNDPAANLTLGQRYGTSDEWDAALPLLARSSDPALQAIAKKDLLRPFDPAEQASMGDVWWELSEKSGASWKDALRRRARHWYEKCAPKLTGFNRAAVEKRLVELRWDRLKGTWVTAAPELFDRPGKSGDPIVIAAKPDSADGAYVKKMPPGEYDGFSARIRLDPERKVHAGLLYHEFNRLTYLQADSQYYGNARRKDKIWDLDHSLEVSDADEFILTVVVSGGEYILYLDGTEVTRIPGAARLSGIGLFAAYGTARFDQIKLRKKE